MDTKLSRETKAGAILQVCLYSEILKELQGSMPVHMYINNPNGKHSYRLDDFFAFYRFMKNKLSQAILAPVDSYPDPVPHCDICKWWQLCNQRRRKDDHLTFIAGMGKLQTQEVKAHAVTTLEQMAEFMKDHSAQSSCIAIPWVKVDFYKERTPGPSWYQSWAVETAAASAGDQQTAASPCLLYASPVRLILRWLAPESDED